MAGVGTVFIAGMLGMTMGIPLMLLWNAKAPDFFRGRTLKRQQAHWVPDEE